MIVVINTMAPVTLYITFIMLEENILPIDFDKFENIKASSFLAIKPLPMKIEPLDENPNVYKRKGIIINSPISMKIIDKIIIIKF